MNKVNHRRLLKTGLLVLALMIGLLSLAACGKKDASSEKVTVNIAINGGLNLLTIAKNKGWFEEEFTKANATVQWNEFQSSVPLLEGLVSDRVDFSFIGDGTVVTGKAANSPFTVISVTGVEGNQNSVVVKPDSPIQSIADLKGKQIAVAKGSSAHIFLIKALQKNGLKESDVNIVQLQPDEANPAFQAGQVDAWGIWDPFVTTETAANRARIVESVKTMNFIAPAVMIGRDKFLKDHPDLTALYLKVYQKAVDWVGQNLDEAADILATEKKMDKALVKTLLENTHYINEPISPEIADAIQSTADILLESGTIKEKLDVSKVYDNSFFEESRK
ncbi:aliphatic sulfonate ABC transporter substrate-binding protein [Paenibacillus eucommiae]|uniref:Sulfonate transport system substrate-binding protein n=1 Tax=Paenibacillus eucommiae TaxID=1355755 RepID=A0ABS4J659_9BACL|nr:aliphatic sulfonate ABC transporter substrate-binding protein [Paenibacillus eucommiae]MBP1995346.1 sulfonate transport system substrate-binding protein [Paenibacillus eucommiae]